MNQRRILAVLLILILCMASVIAAPWIGGYRITFDGWADTAPFSADEHLGVHLYLAPFGLAIADPLISVGVAIPAHGSEPGPLLEGSLEIRLFSWNNHPTSGLFRRPTAWRPTVQVGLITPIRSFDSAELTVGFHPLNFFFGEKSVSVLAPRMLYDFDKGSLSWGIRLLEISHALF
ncbi:MAG: hypothetical protein GX938_04910 [Spirochaetales bacterium]|nr:hypothetical protein [Spirochaetales bacterium]